MSTTDASLPIPLSLGDNLIRIRATGQPSGGSDEKTILITRYPLILEPDPDEWEVGEPPPDVTPVDPEPEDEIVVEQPEPEAPKVIKQQHATNGHRFYDFTGVQFTDVEAFTDVETTHVVNHQFGIYVARSGQNKNQQTAYLLRNDGANMQLCKIVGGTVTVLESVNAGITANTRYRLMLRRYQGQKARFWLASSARPAWVWEIDDPDITGAGRIGMYAHNSTGTRRFHGFGYAVPPFEELPAPAPTDQTAPTAPVLGAVTAGEDYLSIVQTSAASDDVGVVSGVVEWSTDGGSTWPNSRAMTSGELAGDAIVIGELEPDTYHVRVNDVMDAAENVAGPSNVVSGVVEVAEATTPTAFVSDDLSPSTTFTLGNPGLIEGQVAAVFIWVIPGNGTPALGSTPSSFTYAGQVNMPSRTPRLICGYIKATASEPSSYSFTLNGTFSGSQPHIRAALVPLSGVNQTTVLDASVAGTGQGTISTSHPGATLTTATANAIIVRCAVAGENSTSTGEWSPDANGGTEVVTVAPNLSEMVVTQAVKATAGALSSTTFTTTVARRSVNMVMAFRAA